MVCFLCLQRKHRLDEADSLAVQGAVLPQPQRDIGFESNLLLETVPQWIR